MVISELLICSQSPRRHNILNTFGVPFSVIPNKLKIEPTPSPNEHPIDYASRVALAKLLASSQYELGSVLAVDTVVSIGDHILGKPQTKEAALKMLQQLNGKKHTVTSCAVFKDQNKLNIQFCIDYALVYFSEVSEKTLRNYIDQFNPLDKAGSYGIQDNPPFLEQLDGDFYTVMGLPINRLLKLFESYGIVK